MNQKWTDAVAKYEQRTEAQAHEEFVKNQSAAAASRADKAAQEKLRRAIKAAADELQTFISSEEGRAAMALLAASNRHLIFGEERGGGSADVAFIDGQGLRRSIEPHGMWMALASASDIPKPHLSPITVIQAIRSAVTFGGRQPEEVLPWLRGELDKIAEAVE